MEVDSIGFWTGRTCYMRLNNVQGKVYKASDCGLPGMQYEFVGVADKERLLKVLGFGLVGVDFRAGNKCLGKSKGFITDIACVKALDDGKGLFEVTGVINGHPTNEAMRAMQEARAGSMPSVPQEESPSL